MHVITDSEVASAILKLTRAAQKKLLLVSAYFEPWNTLETEIRNAALRGVKVCLLVRGSPTETKQHERARALAQFGVTVLQLDRLHAKLYLNEGAAIATSMNLVQASAHGSWEIATYCLAAEEPETYKKLSTAGVTLVQQALAQQQAEAILQRNQAEAAATASADASPKRAAKRSAPLAEGSCIACGTEIKVNLDRPFCRSCYAGWSGVETERMYHCHTCGEEASTSFLRPRCKACWTEGVGEA